MSLSKNHIHSHIKSGEKMIVSESAGGIILNNKRQICLVNQHGVCWAIPKGHIEKCESAEETARREIKEETGLEGLRLIKKLGILKRKKIRHRRNEAHSCFPVQNRKRQPQP